ncbi:hypothetical protein [Symbiopectobacterium purcellii]|uniref:Uncharacterized protein n=1 Tax=Symbiopectobacterium purcellii TaxID=2871826 RepID=A0ABX9ARJ7_9ENTR|nr:hypothetical protein [Symbiopectobacterium purcellii]QZN97825.1 hypothetical protein K6K13_11275 [Symbiopectobacterium purcellii]
MAKFYGMDSSFIHDAEPKDGFVIDMVRASDYVELEKRIAELEKQRDGLVAENAQIIAQRNEFRAAANRAFSYGEGNKPEDARKALLCVIQRGAFETKTTDAAIAEIGAKAVEDAAEHLFNEGDIGAYEYEQMHEYANKLRGGGV